MQCNIQHAIPRGLRGVSIMAMFVIASTACSADTPLTPTTTSTRGTQPVVAMELADGSLNLLQSPTPRADTSTLRTRRVIGAGSYICSPAGFGQRSRCYSN